ncbi:zinc-binding dehydrogenase [Lacticaseibacillus paracasei]|nr:zinc-binding dehydrogenase [Lacticaseibacillus paracasei]
MQSTFYLTNGRKISEFVGSDKLRPIIDRIFPFAELPKAFAYSQAGHAKGKIILKLVDNPSSLLQV